MATQVTERTFQNACNAYKGFCTHCRKFTRRETEPDAENYDCPKCGQKKVVGAEQAMLLGEIELT